MCSSDLRMGGDFILKGIFQLFPQIMGKNQQFSVAWMNVMVKMDLIWKRKEQIPFFNRMIHVIHGSNTGTGCEIDQLQMSMQVRDGRKTVFNVF